MFPPHGLVRCIGIGSGPCGLLHRD